jgi:hypothetical protein
MSEGLTTTDWAEPEVMQHWRDVVAHRASMTMGREGGEPIKRQSMEARFPEAAAHALYLLSETDMKKSEICKLTGFLGVQLNRLAVANAPTLEQQRPELEKKFTQIASKAGDAMLKKIDRLLEDEALLDATPINHLAIAMGVSIDKAGGLAGVATSVVEHRSGPTLDDAIKFREEVRQRLAERSKAEAIDV